MTQTRKPGRRQFLKQLQFGVGAVMLPLSVNSSCRSTQLNVQSSSNLSFGIVADAHADLIPDKMLRLEKFIENAIEKDVDFIVQLGDFCFPKKENRDFLNLWNQFKKPKYHLLGNHDMDVSSKEVTMDFLEMPAKYYSFDEQGIHFVVLDPNYLYTDHKYLDYDSANFYVDDKLRTYVDPQQIEWLIHDLQQTNLHTIILSHQSLINSGWGIKNRLQIQDILERENKRSGFQKVVACFNGHDHIDFQRQINGIHYVELNSMSYQWLGEKYSNKSRYPAALYEEFKQLDKLGMYQDSLFAFVELNMTAGWVKIKGIQSDWVSPSPKELNIPDNVYGMQYSADISDRLLTLEK